MTVAKINLYPTCSEPSYSNREEYKGKPGLNLGADLETKAIKHKQAR